MAVITTASETSDGTETMFSGEPKPVSLTDPWNRNW
jgi:hypothetical protein